MKTRNIALMIAGVVAAGCALNGQGTRTDPVAKYVISFDKVKLKPLTGPAAFKSALAHASHPRWQKGVVLHYGGSSLDESLPDLTEEPTQPPPIFYTGTVSQNTSAGSNPSSLHVTQKIGLNKPADVEAVLASLEQQ